MKLTLQKLEGWGYYMVKISIRNHDFNHFGLIHPCDRQMKGWAMAHSAIRIYAVVRLNDQ